MKPITMLLAAALLLTSLAGCGLRRDPKVTPTLRPSMTPEDGGVEDNGSEDGVLDTARPDPSGVPEGSQVSHPPETSKEPEGGSLTQPPVNSTVPDSSPDHSPETTPEQG